MRRPSTPAPRPRSLPAVGEALVVAALLLVHAALAVSSLWVKSVTFDEVSHLPAGLAAVATGEPRLNPQHPPLVKLAAGLLARGAAAPLPLDAPAYAAGDEWTFGFLVLFDPEADHWAMLRRGRLATVALSLVGGAVVWAWARRRSGVAPALFATTLWAFSPALLAHHRWVTMDGPVAALWLATFYAWWRTCRDDVDPRSGAVATGAFLGLALATKFTALLALPAMAICELVARGRGDLRRRVAIWGGTLAMAAPVVWAAYLFPADPLAYLRGAGRVYGDFGEDFRAYLAGRTAPSFPLYFPATLWIKSTPVEVVLAAAAAAVLVLRRRAVAWRDEVFLVVPALVWLLATVLLARDLGHRYLLALYPPLFVAGAGLLALVDRRRPAAAAAVALVLVAGQAGEAFRRHPDYLPYASPLAGGTPALPLWLDGSNVDWNQDVGALGPWLAEHGVALPRLALGYGAPARAYGVIGEPVPGDDFRRAPRPGAYVVSGHTLARLWARHLEEGWASDWLCRYRPAATLGGSLYLYVFPTSAERPPEPSWLRDRLCRRRSRASPAAAATG